MHKPATDNDSFVDAQRKAREWADKGIELSGAGDARQARLAAMNAEFWLERMLSIAQTLEAELHWQPPAAPIHRTRPVKLAARKRSPKRSHVACQSVPTLGGPPVSTSTVLLGWKRPDS